MGFDAVYIASDVQLKDELGIKELGVRLSLKAYCERGITDKKNTDSDKEKEGRKRRLLEEIINPKKSKGTNATKQENPKKSSNKKPLTERNVLMGWIHCGKGADEKPKRVGLEKGGGTRQLTATTETTYEELIEAGKAWYFPNGVSQFGKDKEMHFGLADFQRQALEKEEENLSFTVGNYAEKNGFKSRIRVYLTSQLAETIISDSSSESEDDENTTGVSTISLPQAQFLENDEEHVVDNFTSLIGTHDERIALPEEQDRA